MRRSWGIARRRAVVVALAATLALVVSAFLVTNLAAGASGSNGQSTTYTVNCTAHVGSGTTTQQEAITFYAVAPDNVDPGETFTISFPS